MLRFTVYYALYGGVLALIALAIQYGFPDKEWLMPRFWLVFIFLFFLTFIAYGISYLGIKKGGQNGITAILGGIILKLVFAMLLAAVLAVKLSVNQVVFALNYFSLYLSLTLFEVIHLLRNLRDQNNK